MAIETTAAEATASCGDAAGSLSERELSAWRGLLRTHSRMLARLDAELIEAHGMPMTTYEVLLHLSGAEDGNLWMGELAERLLLSRSGLTRLIDRLSDQGLVERRQCPSDRRGALAEITALGRERFEQAQPTHIDGIRRAFIAPLDDEHLDGLGAAWERILGEPG